MALPLCALSNEELKIKLTLEAKENLIGNVNSLTLESFKIFGDFVLLENAERQKVSTECLDLPYWRTVQRLDFITPNTEKNANELSEKSFKLDGIKLSVNIFVGSNKFRHIKRARTM